jgi:hypothetical protein
MLSQPADTTLHVADSVMQNTPVIKLQITFQILRGEPLGGKFNCLYVLISGHPWFSRNLRSLSQLAA